MPVIDANTPLLPFPQYFSVDGVHPNAAGLDTIARVIYRALRAATATLPENPSFHDASPRRHDAPIGIGFPCPGLVLPSTRTFDLTGRRVFREGDRQQAGKAVNKIYIQEEADRVLWQ
jgi:hypothetical protein